MESEIKNPKFANFLNSLYTKIDSDLQVDIKILKKSKELHEKVQKKRQEYFNYEIVNNHLMKYLISQDNKSLPLQTQRQREDLVDEIEMEISKANDRLRENLLCIINDEFLLDSKYCLKDMIFQFLLKIDQLKIILKNKIKNKIQLEQEYVKTLLKCNELLEKLLGEICLEKIPVIHRSKFDWIIISCDALYLKIKTLELQFLDETYTKESMKALNFIKNEITKKTMETKEEMDSNTRILLSYQLLDSSFLEKIKIFKDLKEKLDNKKWILNQMEISEKK